MNVSCEKVNKWKGTKNIQIWFLLSIYRLNGLYEATSQSLQTLWYKPFNLFFFFLGVRISVTYMVILVYLFAGECRFFWIAFDIMRSLFVISVNDGLPSGWGHQHSSINFLHSGSQRFGIRGLSVLFTIPPSYKVHNTTKMIIQILTSIEWFDSKDSGRILTN